MVDELVGLEKERGALGPEDKEAVQLDEGWTFLEIPY
jgi:hypothetical protein